jgi:nitrite reductase/ring-hydroxylating ferredoxin subunit
MMEGQDVYVICRANDLAPGEAKPFSLSRITEAGEAKPFGVFVVRLSRDCYVGYVNTCPHEGTWLNFNAGEFFNEDRSRLKCGRHGALFDIQTGFCVEGPCKDSRLEPIEIAVLDGDLCLCGVELVEDDGLSHQLEDFDDTMEIMIHPE